MRRLRPCPVAAAAKLLGDKWMLVLLRDLADGPCRFTDLERTAEGISPSILSARLRDLECNGLVTRTSYREVPPRVEYELTPMGRDALPVLEALRTYGGRWLLPNVHLSARQAAS
ncbi:MAG: helix-turn-helix transcriptional regulator [Betaproteobacteria bacterium]|nr:helix-turn-helix transcriptional regulator [Betaproteobacteria bacterium]